MIKSLMIAMALISTPVMAEELVNDAAYDARENAGVSVGIGFGFGYGYGWGPRHPGWRDRRPVECVAENVRGMRFVGYGRYHEEAARNAIDNCYYRGSRYCQIRWCR